MKQTHKSSLTSSGEANHYLRMCKLIFITLKFVLAVRAIYSVSRLRRLEFPTTLIEEIAMAASAKTG